MVGSMSFAIHRLDPAVSPPLQPSPRVAPMPVGSLRKGR
jgi:hypothetical protein